MIVQVLGGGLLRKNRLKKSSLASMQPLTLGGVRPPTREREQRRERKSRRPATHNPPWARFGNTDSRRRLAPRKGPAWPAAAGEEGGGSKQQRPEHGVKGKGTPRIASPVQRPFAKPDSYRADRASGVRTPDARVPDSYTSPEHESCTRCALNMHPNMHPMLRTRVRTRVFRITVVLCNVNGGRGAQ